MAEDPGELVGGGAFKIDREAALAKLKKYQLADPWFFVRAWARAAVLSRPRLIECLRSEDESILRFDGEPLPFPDGPYEAMFSEDASSPARHAAVGLLGAMRLDIEGVRVRSGGKGWSFDKDGVETAGDSTQGPTELRVRWPAAVKAERQQVFERNLIEACGMVDVPLTVGDATSTPFVIRRGAVGARGSEGGRRRMVFSPAPSAAGGEVTLYRDGVKVGSSEFPGFEYLSVHLNDDDIGLDLSAAGFVDDRLLLEALAATRRKGEEVYPLAARAPVSLEGVQIRAMTTMALAMSTVAASFMGVGAILGGSGAGGVGLLLFAAMSGALGLRAGRSHENARRRYLTRST